MKMLAYGLERGGALGVQWGEVVLGRASRFGVMASLTLSIVSVLRLAPIVRCARIHASSRS
jgi:hypothetical protein